VQEKEKMLLFLGHAALAFDMGWLRLEGSLK
jgi:hypothetical protein